MKKVLVITAGTQNGFGAIASEYMDIMNAHTISCTKAIVAKQLEVDEDNISVFVYSANAEFKDEVDELNTLNRLASEKYDEVLLIGNPGERFHYTSIKCKVSNPDVKFSICNSLGFRIIPAQITPFAQNGQAFVPAPEYFVPQCEKSVDDNNHF